MGKPTTEEEKEGAVFLNRIMDIVAPGDENPMANAPPLPSDFRTHGALPTAVVATDAPRETAGEELASASGANLEETTRSIQVSDVEPTGGEVTPPGKPRKGTLDVDMEEIDPFSESEAEPIEESKKAIEINSIAPVADKALRAAGETGTAKGGGRDTVTAKATASGVTKDNIKSKEKTATQSESTTSKGGGSSGKKAHKKT